MATGLRALSYARQSIGRQGEDEDSSLSLEAQEAAIRRYCDDHGWVLVDTIRDHDVSGKSIIRPGMAALMDRVALGGIDVVLVYKLSRFARNVIAQENAYLELKDQGVDVVSVTEPGSTNTLVRIVQGAVNQTFLEDLSQTVSNNIRQRAARGLQHGEPPYGYRRVADAEGKRYEVIPELADIVREIFQWRADGFGTMVIADRLNERNLLSESGGAWGRTSIRRILSNPRYAGYAVYRGEIVAGVESTLPPIVDRTLWQQVQRSFGGKRTPRGKVNPSWLEGLVDHECGRPMYLSSTPKRREEGVFICSNNTNTKIARCARTPRHILTSALEDAVRMCVIADIAACRTRPSEAIAAYASYIGLPKVVQEREVLVRRRTRLLEAIERAADIVSNGLRSLAWLAQKNDEQFTELAAIDRRLAELADLPTEESIKPTIAQVGAMRDGIQHASDDGVRKALARIGRARFGSAGVSIVYHEEFRPLFPSPVIVTPTYNYATRRYDLVQS